MSLISEHKQIEKRSRAERERDLNHQARIVLFCLVKKYGPLVLNEADMNYQEGELKTAKVDDGIEWRVV